MMHRSVCFLLSGFTPTLLSSLLSNDAVMHRRNRQLWWIQSVYVHPQHRRKGYFRQLYMHVKQLAQNQEAGGLRLYADSTNVRAHTTVSSHPFSHKMHCAGSYKSCINLSSNESCCGPVAKDLSVTPLAVACSMKLLA